MALGSFPWPAVASYLLWHVLLLDLVPAGPDRLLRQHHQLLYYCNRLYGTFVAACNRRAHASSEERGVWIEPSVSFQGRVNPMLRIVLRF